MTSPDSRPEPEKTFEHRETKESMNEALARPTNDEPFFDLDVTFSSRQTNHQDETVHVRVWGYSNIISAAQALNQIGRPGYLAALVQNYDDEGDDPHDPSLN